MLIYEKWIKLAALRKPKEDTHVRLGTGKVFKPGIKRGAVPYGENIHGADCICDCDGGPSDVCPAHCTVAYRQKPVRKKKQDGADGAPKKSAGREPRMNNGTRNDLTVFVSQLLKTANKNGMGVVAPGLVEYKGKTAQLVAFLVAPSGVTGIYCLGFGGVVMPGEKDGPWKQHMNGQDTTFRNPLAVCKEQYELVRAAMDEAGVKADLDIVTVFTNSRVTLKAVPSARIYTQKQFMEHLKNTDSLKRGDVDVKEMTKVLARLAKIKEKKAGRNKKQREQEG